MNEALKEILKQMISRIFNMLYGERAIVFRITIVVIVFFKAFVTRIYTFSFCLSPLIFAITALVLVTALAFRSRYKLDASNGKIIFLYCSLGIGTLYYWISSKAWPVPEMSWFIEKVSNTSRLSWLAMMCQWDNIVPSLYLITYFVSRVYLFICFFKAIGYMNDVQNGMINIHEGWLNHTCKYAAVAVFCCGSWTYGIIHLLFVLLE